MLNDPITDAAYHDRQMYEYEKSLPHCDNCGEPIDDECYEIEGAILCIDCVKQIYGKDVDDYVG